MNSKHYLLEGDSLRLLYGVGGPLIAGLVVIIAALVLGSEWLVIPMMLAVFALTATVVIGFGHMISDDDGRTDER